MGGWIFLSIVFFFMFSCCDYLFDWGIAKGIKNHRAHRRSRKEMLRQLDRILKG